MDSFREEYPFRYVLSFEPLLRFWNENMTVFDGDGTGLPDAAKKRLDAAPELRGSIEDLSLLTPHMELIERLMSPVFPEAFWETDALAAVVPFSMEHVIGSPAWQRLLVTEDGSLRGQLHEDGWSFDRIRLMRAFNLILGECYGFSEGLWEYQLIWVAPDQETGLDRYYHIKPDLRFVEVRNLGGPKELSDRQRATIMDHLTEPEVLREILPPEHYEFAGFTVFEAEDVTQPQILRALDKGLIEKDSVFSPAGFLRLQHRLRTLFRNPELTVGVAAIKGDQVYLLAKSCEMQHNCIFGDSRHAPISEFLGSVFDRALEADKVVHIRDLQAEPNLSRADQDILAMGTRSLLLAPLYYQEQLIGTLKLGSPNPGEFGPTDAMVATQMLPLFSVALKRALDKLDNDVQVIIKEKCTAVHPSVEWRFHRSVMEHLERLHAGVSSELEPIVFRDVYPLYGATDIRGSSDARNRSIRADLDEHLQLGLKLVQAARDARPIPILQELAHRIDEFRDGVQGELGTGDEERVTHFMRTEVEPLFPLLRGFGVRVSEAIGAYEREVDSSLGTVYSKRKEFEESVSLFNERLSAYLDLEEEEAQSIFPHYFDKHKTDGVDHVIYVGESMVEGGGFNEIYARNLRLWQIMVACGLAWHTEHLKAELKVPLAATHLVLVNHNPLSIRFRFDEKRFDVDGAYDIAHEIIRSRIDKAMVKGGRERLTQPGKIAIVYSRPEEAEEMHRHIRFLQSQGYITDEMEALDLDDLPDVHGLKAFRVKVDLESLALAKRAGRSVALSLSAQVV